MIRRELLAQGPASLVILTVLLLQGVAVCGSVSSLLWPFTDYPMYRAAHHEGETMHEYTVIGVLDDGREVPITRGALGFKVWQFDKHLVEPLRRRELDADDRGRLSLAVGHYQRISKHRLAALRLESQPYVLTKVGLRAAPAQVMKEIELDQAGIVSRQ